MLHRASPRAQLVFYAQALPTIGIAFVAALGVVLVLLKISSTWALVIMSGTLAFLLGVAIATRTKSEARIKRLTC